MIKLVSNAKINSYLRIISKNDSLHNLDTDIIKINLKNDIFIEENNLNEDLVYINKKRAFNTNTEKTLKELRKIIKIPFYNVNITSNIPISAGLGSSSCDSAEILKYFQKTFKLEDSDIKNISIKIGSDVYALTKDYNTRIIGIGIEIKKLEKINFDSIILVYNDVVISTKEAFDKYDIIDKSLLKSTNDLLIPSILISSDFKNDYDKLNLIKKGFKMSGSGSAMFFEENEENKLSDKELEELKKEFKIVKRIKVLNN